MHDIAWWTLNHAEDLENLIRKVGKEENLTLTLKAEIDATIDALNQS